MSHESNHLTPEISAWKILGLLVGWAPYFDTASKTVKKTIATGTGLKLEYYRNVQFKRLAKTSIVVQSSTNNKDQLTDLEIM